MAAIGGNSAGQGSHLTINMSPMHVFAMHDSVQLCSAYVWLDKFCLIVVPNPVFEPVGDAVVNVYINHEKKFAFVEMRTVEEASNAMALDGIIFEACHYVTFFFFLSKFLYFIFLRRIVAVVNKNETNGCENEMTSTYGIETLLIMYIVYRTALSIDSDKGI